MPGLFDKLNVMVRAGVHDLINNVTDAVSGEAGKIFSQRPGKDLHNDVEALRQRIEDALKEEDLQQRRLDDLAQDIASLDRQADEALQGGNEANAHFLAEQFQRKQRQEALWRAELEEHRRATSELIERVNVLDAMTASSPSSAPPAPSPASTEEPVHHIHVNIGSSGEAPKPIDAKDTAKDAVKNTAKESDPDLAQRRSRLSKPD